jgi:hypothetical protein
VWKRRDSKHRPEEVQDAPGATTPAPTTTTDDRTPDEDTDDPTPSDDPVIATITAYFDFLPGDPDAAWALLTTDAQASLEKHGDGLARYRQGWDQHSSIHITHVYDDSNYATVMYDSQYKDGRPGGAKSLRLHGGQGRRPVEDRELDDGRRLRATGTAPGPGRGRHGRRTARDRGR